MELLKQLTLNDKDKEVIFDLWNTEYPVNLSFQNITEMDNYLSSLPGLICYILKNEQRQTEGWAMTYIAGGETWFAITISENVQGRGKGTYLLDRLKNENDLLNGWVIDHENDIKRDGQNYKSPLAFYEKNDFQIFPQYRLELPNLSAVKIAWYSSKPADTQKNIRKK